MLTMQASRKYPWPLSLGGQPLRAQFLSSRDTGDPLYFDPINVWTKQFMTAEESKEGGAQELGQMALGVAVASLMVVCIILQTRHMHRNPEEVAHMSLLTPAFLGLGLAVSVLSCLVDDVFKKIPLPLWGKSSPSVPPAVLAAQGVAAMAAAYLVHRVVRWRHQRGQDWMGQARHCDSELQVLLSDPEKASNLEKRPQSGTADMAPAKAKAQKFWTRQKADLLPSMWYLFLAAAVWETLVPFWFGFDNFWGLYNFPKPRSLDGGTSSIAAVVLGIIGCGFQDLCLLPQVVHSLFLPLRDRPLHPWFAYGVIVGRCLAHFANPRSQLWSFGVLPMQAAYYYLLWDSLAQKVPPE